MTEMNTLQAKPSCSSHSERPIPHLLFSLRYTIFAPQLRAEGYVQEVGGADIMIKSVY